MKHLFLAVVLLGLVPVRAWADDVVLSGTVSTKAEGLGLPGATVSIDALGVSVTTDAQGRYTLSVPAQPGKTAQLKIAAPGFAAKTQNVELNAGPVTLDYALSVGFSEELVVGSRAPGVAAEKAVPVDIITSRQIVATGLSETAQVIQALAPSLNFPRPTITDGTDTVRPATLRGLGPDQVLVLINGKRRHNSALVHLNGSIGRGSTGVDLNAIPVSSIERIEILRDGAAAQYGSDAIAGVVNIVLKSGVQPLSLSLAGGLNKGSFTGNSCSSAGLNCVLGNDIDFSDGEMIDGGGSYGFKLGRGTATLSAQIRRHDRTNRASFDPRDQIVAGDAGNNAVAEPNHRWGDPDTRDVLTFLNVAVPVGSSGTTSVYAFGGYSHRDSNSAGFFRRALDVRNWPQIYPQGFLPTIQPTVVDASGTIGVHGVVAETWTWDVSAQQGHNSFDFAVGDSLNTSLGPNIPPNKTFFEAGTLGLDQLTVNADVTRAVKAGLAGPLNVAFGAEFRRESYSIKAGEPDSYRDGGVKNIAGGVAALGAQVFPGFQPKNAVDVSRHDVAFYVDLEGDVLKRLKLGAAGRFENYSDFGSTVDGKLTARFAVTEKVVLRGAAATGFRAPSLAQSYFSSTATNFLNVPGQGLQPFESLTAPVGSQVARALGAKDLEPENSVHFSAGLVVNPTSAFQLSADFYHIAIDDRIVLSGNFNQAQVLPLLQPLGASSARFFTNAINTRTNGIDVVASYNAELGSAGKLGLSASYNHNETKLVGTIVTPPQLEGLGAVLFDRIEQRRVTCGQPSDGGRLGADWRKSRWGGNLRLERYGSYCSFTLAPADDQEYAAKVLTDLDFSFREAHYSITIGAQNLFNVLPDRNITVNSFSGIQTFPSQSPFGMNGRYVYARLGVTF